MDFQRDLSTRIFPIVMRLNSPLPPIDRVPRGARDMIQEMSSRAARVAEAFVALDKALASGDSKRAWRLAREVSWTFDLSFFEILLRRHGRDS